MGQIGNLTYGWMYVTDGTDFFRLDPESYAPKRIRKPTINHYPGGGSYGYDVGEKWYLFKVKNIYFNNADDKDNALTYLNSWSEAGTLTISFYKNTSLDKEKIDGTNTDYPVLYYGEEYDKIAPENGTIYRIKMMKFEQSGEGSI